MKIMKYVMMMEVKMKKMIMKMMIMMVKMMKWLNFFFRISQSLAFVL